MISAETTHPGPSGGSRRSHIKIGEALIDIGGGEGIKLPPVAPPDADELSPQTGDIVPGSEFWPRTRPAPPRLLVPAVAEAVAPQDTTEQVAEDLADLLLAPANVDPGLNELFCAPTPYHTETGPEDGITINPFQLHLAIVMSSARSIDHTSELASVGA